MRNLTHPRIRHWQLMLGLLLGIIAALLSLTVDAQPATIRFAVIGDYGWTGANELAAANLVKSWSPDFVVTTGDNNYDLGSATTIDANIGQYYHDFIYPYAGSYGAGAATNRFFPVLGNHDWGTSSAQPYKDYFALPGNERYYTFTNGAVQFFMLDSDGREPDGVSSTSIQGTWLQTQLAASTAPWKLVLMHHPPYSSGAHGSNAYMRWPYQAWGASAVLTGHDHIYERLLVSNLPYFVVGAGGKSLYGYSTIRPESVIRHNSAYGAMLVTASASSITFQYYSVTNGGTLIDTYTLDISAALIPTSPANAHPSRNLNPSSLSWNGIPWAAGYHIQIDDDAAFHSPAVELSELNAATLSFTMPTLPAGKYYWRVRAKRPDGSWSAWSASDKFVIQ